jgi:hypothetical protein
MELVYRKTERGLVEMNTRELRLAPRLRSALILIDGKKMDYQLQGLLGPQCADTLAALQDLGLIEAIRPIRIGSVPARR